MMVNYYMIGEFAELFGAQHGTGTHCGQVSRINGVA
jgi:hypothetical protein